MKTMAVLYFWSTDSTDTTPKSAEQLSTEPNLIN